ncbi:MAG: LacI family DNA-binding transcriptional regulator [Candidatus Goldbacteria bacterium]|nr:LacI family DNA-binding transcriptional regulator [Candidatus Goldiibacteriota bacterium]
MKKITIKEIAKKAGVSKATVSMVLNNYDRIADATREKVLRVVKDMHYYPHESARMLAKKKSDSIAFVSARFAAPFISNILDAIEQRAFTVNKYVHGIIPFSTRNEKEAKDELLRRILYSRKADSVIVLTLKPEDEIIKEYNDRKLPLILIENEMPGVHSIRVDNYKGAYQATEHLIKKGRKNICLISGVTNPPENLDINPAAIERKKGFEDTMHNYNVNYNENNIEYIEQYTFDEGKTALDNLLKKNSDVDAIFCAAGDIVAMGVIKRAHEIGIKIPDDLAIIGYDDIIVAKLLNPPLTSVRQPIEDIGKLAFDIAIDAMEGKLKEEKHVVIEPELIIRATA